MLSFLKNRRKWAKYAESSRDAGARRVLTDKRSLKRWDREFVMGPDGAKATDETKTNFADGPQVLEANVGRLRPGHGTAFSKPVSTFRVFADTTLQLVNCFNGDVELKIGDSEAMGIIKAASEDDDSAAITSAVDAGSVKLIANVQYFSEIEIVWDDNGKIRFMHLRTSTGEQHQLQHRMELSFEDPVPLFCRKETGRLLITGVFETDGVPTAFQIVDLFEDPDAGSPLISCFDDFNRSIKQNSLLHVYRMYSKQSAQPLNLGDGGVIGVGFQNMIGVGVASNDVLRVFLKLIKLSRIESEPRSISLDFAKILEACYEGDLNTIHTVFTLHKFMNYVISENLKFLFEKVIDVEHWWTSSFLERPAAWPFVSMDFLLHELLVRNKMHRDQGDIGLKDENGHSVLPDDWANPVATEPRNLIEGVLGPHATCSKQQFFQAMIKSRVWWSGLAKSLKTMKRINFYTPSIDIYTLTFLDPSPMRWLTSIVTFATQVGMAVILLCYADRKFKDEGFDFDSNSVSSYAVIMISIVVAFIAKKQIEGFLQFVAVFPESKKELITLMGFIANVVIALLVIPLNALLLVNLEDQDIVLGALSVLFILEIDDQVIDLSPMDEKTVYLSRVQEQMTDEINARMITKNSFGIEGFRRLFRNQDDPALYRVNPALNN